MTQMLICASSHFKLFRDEDEIFGEKKILFSQAQLQYKVDSQQTTHNTARLTVTVPYLTFPLCLLSVLNVITDGFYKANGMKQEERYTNISHLTVISRTNRAMKET